MKIDAPKRSIVKTLSWRVASLIITFSVTWIITKSTRFAFSISLFDTAIKLVIYYLHERGWSTVKWGRKKVKKKKKKKEENL